LAADCPAGPVTDEEFASRCDDLNLSGPFAVAVSGGRDSMALALLAASYARTTGARVTAFTVDHGLRPEAADEARRAAGWCESLGLIHRTLRWEGEKPTAGLQAAAREARYYLLAAAAETSGVNTILTGHSADDQAETVFMRLARGAGPRGLAAMDEESLIAAGAGAPVRLLRPLLRFSRARLTATVEAAGQGYVDDPYNDDPAFERIRTRALLAALEEQGLLMQRALLKTAERMRAADRRLEAQCADLFRRAAGCFYGWGGAALQRSAAAAMGSEEAGALAARLLHAVSGEAHRPDEDAAAAALDATLASGAATLGGALIKSLRDRVWFLREPAAVLGRAGAPAIGEITPAAGAVLNWDGRFIIEVSGENIAVAPLGEAGSSALGFRKDLFAGPPEGLLALPAAYRNGELIAAAGGLFTSTGEFAARQLASERFRGGIIRFSPGPGFRSPPHGAGLS